jgi:hypothetical protein
MARTKSSSIFSALVITLIHTTTAATPLPLTFTCSRAALSEAANAYITAQTSGTIQPIQPFLSQDVTYIENNNQTTYNTSILSKPLKIDHSRTIYDLETCATYTEIIAAGNATPYTIATQIRHEVVAGNSTNSGVNETSTRITSIDIIASTTGAWLFNATKTLSYIRSEDPFWIPLPVADQSSRKTLTNAADAYLDLWSDAEADKKVPWGTPCVRLEGSAYTGTGAAYDSCRLGIPLNHTQRPNSRRRYVVDLKMGSVSVSCVWEHMVR